MNFIQLKSFQTEAIDAILNQFENTSGSPQFILKAPTGSGKTITLIGLIERMVENYKGKYIYCWLTPGKGDLEEQSKDKMNKYTPNLLSGTLSDILINGFSCDTTYFINWEAITRRGNIAIKEGERKNLYERLSNAHKAGFEFILIIDEEHLNRTNNAADIIHMMNPIREIRVSATPTNYGNNDHYEISESVVIAEELITKALYINNGLDETYIGNADNERDLLIDKAVEVRSKIAEAYKEEGEDINPLVLIQFPSLSDRIIEKVEQKLEKLGYTYDNGLLASWFSAETSEEKKSTKLGKYNIGTINESDSITLNNAKPMFLLFKQALATGWDCPRAKILVKLRDNMNESFEIQTLGRLRRMPNAKHYGRDILDYAFLYTLDEKYKDAVLQAGAGYEVKRLRLKNAAKSIKIYTQHINWDENLVDYKEARKALYEFIKKEYKLSSLIDNPVAIAKNRSKLEAYNYKFDTKLERSIFKGKFQRTLDILTSHDKTKVYFDVNTHEHSLLVRHEIDRFSKILGLKYVNMNTIMRSLFLKVSGSLLYKILPLERREFFAFIINNKELLRELFTKFEESNSLISLGQSQSLMKVVKEHEKGILTEEVFPYIPDSNEINFKKNVYEGYGSSIISSHLFRSTPEILFETFCENVDNVEFVYKNGDKGTNYFSIIYYTALGKIKNFYPDYVVRTKDKDIWIIETKGGETTRGQDKNIDIECKHKLNALANFAKAHGYKFGFVRDKNSQLFINTTSNWISDMSDPVWQKLEFVL